MVAKNLKRLAQDEQGASLSIALLLFLVCTVVASIVLVAGTTASGRLANLATMDQCYYGATSAVELFQSQLEEEKNDETKCLTVTETIRYTRGESGGNNTYTVAEDNVATTPASAGDTLTNVLGVYLVYGEVPASIGETPAFARTWEVGVPIDEDDWYTMLDTWEMEPPHCANATSTPLTLDLSFTSSGGTELTGLGTNAHIQFRSDGSARVTFSNTNAQGNITYRVYATLVPTIEPSASVQPGDKLNESAETKTTRLWWELTDVTSERVMV